MSGARQAGCNITARLWRWSEGQRAIKPARLSLHRHLPAGPQGGAVLSQSRTGRLVGGRPAWVGPWAPASSPQPLAWTESNPRIKMWPPLPWVPQFPRELAGGAAENSPERRCGRGQLRDRPGGWAGLSVGPGGGGRQRAESRRPLCLLPLVVAGLSLGRPLYWSCGHMPVLTAARQPTRRGGWSHGFPKEEGQAQRPSSRPRPCQEEGVWGWGGKSALHPHSPCLPV